MELKWGSREGGVQVVHKLLLLLPHWSSGSRTISIHIVVYSEAFHILLLIVLIKIRVIAYHSWLVLLQLLCLAGLLTRGAQQSLIVFSFLSFPMCIDARLLKVSWHFKINNGFFLNVIIIIFYCLFQLIWAAFIETAKGQGHF